MRKSRGFTLIELLVVIAIISLLMAILMPALARARAAARTSVCLSNLHQYGIVSMMYCGDNDGYFPTGWLYASGGDCDHWPEGKGEWTHSFRDLYQNKEIRYCPSAKKKMSETQAGTHGGTLTAWGPFPYDEETCNTIGVAIEEDDWGSYGINLWLYNYSPVGTVVDGYTVYHSYGDESAYFRHIDSRPAGKIPVFIGCAFPSHHAANPTLGPLNYENIQLWATIPYPTPVWAEYNNMGKVQLNRHSGTVGSVFLDGAARRIGLKELWTLNWSKTWDTCGPWTKCGEPDTYTLETNWDLAAPWMKNMPEY